MRKSFMLYAHTTTTFMDLHSSYKINVVFPCSNLDTLLGVVSVEQFNTKYLVNFSHLFSPY